MMSTSGTDLKEEADLAFHELLQKADGLFHKLFPDPHDATTAPTQQEVRA
jgi:hypothetical protein